MLGNTVYIRDNTGNDNETGFLDRISGGETVADMEYDSVGNLMRFVQQFGGLSNGTEMANAYTYENDRIVSITHYTENYKNSTINALEYDIQTDFSKNLFLGVVVFNKKFNLQTDESVLK